MSANSGLSPNVVR